jgi:ssRNA-specific RNase YbeY (16S rRNA maturation enzyme)
MNIEFQTARVVLPATEAQMKHWLRAGLNASLNSNDRDGNYKNGVLTIRFVGTIEGKQLNQQFRQKNYATNILTFAYSQKPLCADLVLCMPVVRQEAREQTSARSFGAFTNSRGVARTRDGPRKKT